MNRKELAKAIAGDAGCEPVMAERMLASLTRQTMHAVKKGEQVALTGFGVFERQDRRARKGRNPQTGAAIKVKAVRAPRFRAGATFKGVVAGKAPLPAMPGGGRSSAASGGRTAARASSARSSARSSGSRPASASRSAGRSGKPAAGRKGTVRPGGAGDLRRGSRSRS